jgi:hypothetical protein
MVGRKPNWMPFIVSGATGSVDIRWPVPSQVKMQAGIGAQYEGDTEADKKGGCGGGSNAFGRQYQNTKAQYENKTGP